MGKENAKEKKKDESFPFAEQRILVQERKEGRWVVFLVFPLFLFVRRLVSHEAKGPKAIGGKLFIRVP